MSIVYPKVGGIQNANYLGSFTWANKPSATAVAGATAYISNVGAGGGGSYWYSDGVIWRPVGKCVLQLRTDADATSATSETKTQSQMIPAGLLQAGLTLRVFSNIIKSNTTYTGTVSFRFGTANTVGDTLIGSAISQPATTNRQMVTIYDIVRISSTSCRVVTMASAFPYGTGTYLSPDITVSNMDSNAMYITQTLSISNAAESLSNKAFAVEIF